MFLEGHDSDLTFYLEFNMDNRTELHLPSGWCYCRMHYYGTAMYYSQQ